MIDLLVDAVIVAMLVVVAVAVGQSRNLLAAAMLTGIYSLLSASWMLVLDAPDVAYTEAAVGAGISTVLLLATLSLVSQEEKPRPTSLQAVPLFVALVTGLVLLYGTLDMPSFADPAAPIHHHVAPHYLQASGHEIGIPNVITSVLASYRGYDTLGETTVVLTAAVGVLALLGGRPRRPAPAAEASAVQDALLQMELAPDDRHGEAP